MSEERKKVKRNINKKKKKNKSEKRKKERKNIAFTFSASIGHTPQRLTELNEVCRHTSNYG